MEECHYGLVEGSLKRAKFDCRLASSKLATLDPEKTKLRIKISGDKAFIFYHGAR